MKSFIILRYRVLVPSLHVYFIDYLLNDAQVNERLLEMGIKFMDGKKGKKDYNVVENGDVVILPAFGATIQEMQLLDEKYELRYIYFSTFRLNYHFSFML